MFLALTPLSDFWEKDEEILLIGAWCAPYEKREELASLRWRMLPSPWTNRQRFNVAVAYADAVYHRLLLQLVTSLNRIHGVQKSLAYWRLLVGPWLLHHVHAAYDRYTHLSDALSRFPELRTSVLAERCFRTPSGTAEALTWVTQDHHYNWQLFSELIGLIGGLTRQRECVVSSGAVAPLARPRSVPRLSDYAGRSFNAMGGGRSAWLTDVNASKTALIGLAVRSGFRVLPFRVRDELSSIPADPVWDQRRASLGDVPVSDEFERACVTMLARHLPTIYLEGFEHARRMVQRKYPRPPRLLVSETGWYGNETHKFLAAESLGRGTRMVTVQHGGCYGLVRSAPLESLETAIGHRYFVWGWARGQRSLRNVPHPVVSWRPRRWRRRLPARVLFAPQSTQPYLHRFQSEPSGTQWMEHWDSHGRFLDALPDQLRRRIVLRPPPVDFGSGIQQRICDRYPSMAVDTCATFKHSVASSRMTVVETPGTAVLESLSMNAPTILYLDPDLWDIRDEAAPYIERLRLAEILWDSPEAAAAHVAAVYEDPELWWAQESVQTARMAFVERFALGRESWVRSWLTALREELALSPSSLPSTSDAS